MDKRVFKAISTKTGRLAVGLVAETATHYSVEGFWLAIQEQQGQSNTQSVSLQSAIVPFSPVGGVVGVITIAKTSVEGEVTLPPYIEANIKNIIEAEVDNKVRKDQLLRRPVPGGTMMHPEDAIAGVAQYVEKHGRLPSGSMSEESQGAIFGTFEVIRKGPYRRTAEALSEAGDGERG